MTAWGTLSERIRHKRIKVALAARAYEIHNNPIISDHAYDQLAQEVHRTRRIATGNSRLDNFFRRHFDPHSGLWIHKHPHPQRLDRILMQVMPQYRSRRKKKRSRRVP